MIRGILYALVAILVSGICVAVIVPMLSSGENADKLAQQIGTFSPVIFGIPAFVVGWRSSKKTHDSGS